MIGFKLPAFAAASGLPGTGSVYGMELRYATPISGVMQTTNISARTPNGWTQNPLAPQGATGGLLGNGFDGKNV